MRGEKNGEILPPALVLVAYGTDDDAHDRRTAGGDVINETESLVP